MSSIVRASASTSSVPCAGIEDEKSPWPSRSAECRERLERRADPPREQERNEEREAGQQDRDECEPADEARDRARHVRGREPRFDQEDRLAGRGEKRQARRELLARGNRRDGDVAGGERLRMQVPERRLDCLEPVGHGQEAHFDADLLRELRREPVVELADRHDPPAHESRYFGDRAERAALAARDHEPVALFARRVAGPAPSRPGRLPRR